MFLCAFVCVFISTCVRACVCVRVCVCLSLCVYIYISVKRYMFCCLYTAGYDGREQKPDNDCPLATILSPNFFHYLRVSGVSTRRNYFRSPYRSCSSVRVPTVCMRHCLPCLPMMLRRRMDTSSLHMERIQSICVIIDDPIQKGIQKMILS